MKKELQDILFKKYSYMFELKDFHKKPFSKEEEKEWKKKELNRVIKFWLSFSNIWWVCKGKIMNKIHMK